MGSFVTAVESPNDVDVLLIVGADCDVESVPESCKVLFDHEQARLRFHADLFWSKVSIGDAMLGLLLDTYQTGKDWERRGIVEVVL